MTRKYSMAYLSANGADPVEAVQIAADAGYDMVSFRLLPGGPTDVVAPILTDVRLSARVMAALRDTGVGFADAEMIRIGARFELDSYTPFLERIAEMGARHVLVAGDDPDRVRITANYGRLCERLDAYGLSADLEFMPWTAVKTIGDALEIIRAANHRRAAILLDALHFDRCGSTLDEIAAIPPDLINYVQICDGPVPYEKDDAALIRVAREARLIPGEGGVDLPAIFRRLPPDATVSVEVPDKPRAAAMGRGEFARAALEATKKLLAESLPAAGAPPDPAD